MSPCLEVIDLAFYRLTDGMETAVTPDLAAATATATESTLYGGLAQTPPRFPTSGHSWPVKHSTERGSDASYD